MREGEKQKEMVSESKGGVGGEEERSERERDAERDEERDGEGESER